MRRIRIADGRFDADVEVAALLDGRADIGATVSFMGWCRDEGGTLAALELEHFPGMAEVEIERLVVAAETRWPLLGTCVVHRCGLVRPGEPIVLVATAARHRAAAFAAAEYLMDFLKTDAPFWKREHRRDAAPGAAQTWVAAKPDDDDARARWAEMDPRHRQIDRDP
jgi:molybdopterin synthase catalytic subunit